MRYRKRAAIRVAGIAALGLIGLLALGGSALAATVTNQRPLLFSFDGSDTTAGKFSALPGDPSQAGAFNSGVTSMAFDDSTGSLYVADGTAEAIDRFDAEGKAKDFIAGPAEGMSSLFGPSSSEPFGSQTPHFFEAPPGLAVDNSGGLDGPGEGEQGRLYVCSQDEGLIDAFDQEGNFLWSFSPQFGEENLRGIAVDAQGHLWASFGEVFDESGIPVPRGEVLEFDTTGGGTPSPSPIREIEITTGTRLPGALAIDKSGEDLYVASDFRQGGVAGREQKTLDKYVDGSLDSTVPTEPVRALTDDQAETMGHIFAVTQPDSNELESSLAEYEPCSAAGCGASPVSSSDPGLIGDGRGVAYNPMKDWVYVSDHLTQTVKVFGPRASGPVPATTIEATGGITKTEATVHGTINPEGVQNSYHFEVVRAQVQQIVVNGHSGRFWIGDRNLERHPVSEHPEGVSNALPFDVSPAVLQAELEAILGHDTVTVTGTSAGGGVPGEFQVVFENGLAGRNVPLLHGLFLLSLEEQEEGEPYKGGFLGGATVEVKRSAPGELWAQSAQQRTRPEAYPGIEPTDDASHAVSQQLSGLQPNTAYDTRLVGTNTEPEGNPAERLDGYSNVETFITLPPPRPDVSDLTVSSVTTESAHVSFSVDPHEDGTTWRVLTSGEVPFGSGLGPCEALPQSAFDLAGEGTIPATEAGPVAIDRDLAELESGSTVCVRVIAFNGGGAGRGDVVLTTGAVKPSEAALAFVAPRTGTTARLNAYVNPEGGSPLTYQFEYSVDGSGWTSLPQRISTTAAHAQIVVGDALTGLTENTSYSYRLAVVKNAAGEIPKSSLGEVKTFTTRTSAEMTIPPNAFGESEKRGFELVNSPDKGDQNARGAELYSGAFPLRSDGEEYLWTVVGGAPGANSGTQATFLAQRTDAGWVSRSLLPPAADQVGGGSLSYYPVAASSDYSRFIFAPAVPSIITTGPPTFVRLDLYGNQQILHTYQSEILFREDVTADTAHVLVVDPDSHKLQDIGSGTPEEIALIPAENAPIGVGRPGGSPPKCDLSAAGGSFIGGGEGAAASQFETGYHRMATTDASRVYFQVHPDSTFPSCGGPWTIYERNREVQPPTTIPIVPPSLATPDTAIIRATPNGRSLYFVTSNQLVSADTNSEADIYRWDEESHKTTCLTCGVKNESGQSIPDAAVDVPDTRVMVSDDFSHIYFTSLKKLDPKRGVEGVDNLYVLSGGKVRFVASSVRLTGSASLSTDGSTLTFRSSRELTADPVAASCPDVINGGSNPCTELYRYDDRDGSIECLSCRRGGTTENDATLSSFGPEFLQGEPFEASADGSTVAFVTAEALVPGDANRSADLYEWRNGAIRLITDGATHYPEGLAGPIPQGIDPDGSNIIFSLASPELTGHERDGVANVYDARLGGGFSRPTPPVHCSEEECQGPVHPAPQAASIGSSADQGPSVPPARPKCRKGKVRRHGHCIKKGRGRHQHHRRGHTPMKRREH